MTDRGGKLHKISHHPVYADLITRVRNLHISQKDFRASLALLAQFLLFEALKEHPVQSKPVRIWRGMLDLPTIDQQEIVFVGVMRGALGMLDGATIVLGEVPVGFIASTRDTKTLDVEIHYSKIPQIYNKDVFLFDVMLGTGNTLCNCIELIKKGEPRSITCICAIASPAGLDKVGAEHSDVAVRAAQLDEKLDSKGFIYPGTGDIGERSFNQTVYNRKFFS